MKHFPQKTIVLLLAVVLYGAALSACLPNITINITDGNASSASSASSGGQSSIPVKDIDQSTQTSAVTPTPSYESSDVIVDPPTSGTVIVDPPPARDSHNEIQAIVNNYIVPRWEIMDNHIGEKAEPAAHTYEYIADTENRGLWIGTKGSFHDDDNDKDWFFFDENYQAYFVYRHANHTEYRYYIYNGEVIKYSVGEYNNGQVSYYRGDSNFDTSVDSIVNQARAAFRTVKNVSNRFW